MLESSGVIGLNTVLVILVLCALAIIQILWVIWIVRISRAQASTNQAVEYIGDSLDRSLAICSGCKKLLFTTDVAFTNVVGGKVERLCASCAPKNTTKPVE